MLGVIQCVLLFPCPFERVWFMAVTELNVAEARESEVSTGNDLLSQVEIGNRLLVWLQPSPYFEIPGN